jgi:hypothetical protein
MPGYLLDLHNDMDALGFASELLEQLRYAPEPLITLDRALRTTTLPASCSG